MKNLKFLSCAMALPSLTALPAQAAGEQKPAAADKRPNVIFILMDDAGLGDFGCYGQTRTETPNIDALAASGIRFTDIRPGFVATPLLAGDGHYPMLMKTEKVAARIMRVLKRRRRRVVIDRRYAVMVFFWKLIPEWLWERLNIRKNE